MTWIVYRIIDENEDRTTCEDISTFLCQCEEDGLKLVAATGGYLFFRSGRGAGFDAPPPDDEDEDEPEVVYEAPAEPVEVTHSAPTVKKGRPSRTPRPDPSVRPSGSDLDPATGLPLSAIRGEMRLQPVLPQSAPADPNDPFGLS